MHYYDYVSNVYVAGQSHLLVKELYTNPDLHVHIYLAVS